MRIIIDTEEFRFNISGLTKIGRGGEGDIYLLHYQGKSYALKVYFQPSEEKKKKVVAMLDNPPAGAVQAINSLTFIQLAWPVGICYEGNQFKGFVMPYVDLSHSSTLDFYLDKRLYEEKFPNNSLSLAFKIDIAKNLAGVVKLLHSKGHFFIDFKPQNVRVYDRYHLISLIDCDGFSILGKDGLRSLAKSFSSEYIAPEALRNNSQPETLAVEQDLFALAVVIFQLLNYGIHPFSGLISSSDSATTTDDKVAKGYYPYGLSNHLKINPVKGSVHETIDGSIRALFDRAFTGHPSARPTVDEWISVLDKILTEKKLVKCKSHPAKSDHIHFESGACQTCFRDGMVKNVRVPSKVHGRKTSNSSTANASQSTSSVTKSSLLPHEKWILIAIAAVIFIALLANLGGKKEAPSPAIPPPAAPTINSSNPVTELAGFWQTGSTCSEKKLRISASGSMGGVIEFMKADSSKNNSEFITSSERLPQGRYRLISKDADNPDIQFETVFVKEGPNQIRAERLIQIAPVRKMIIVNGKSLSDETTLGSLERCK